ncbi:uncharacterized protein LOC132142405 [Carassius carassius]|uniref:uncharacterized protein LOC132142405 n=1 Tax=Carassius carassius TaxID=217509 RepID=UPI0028696558|nr:uncharacterized protein LOC132142405 [Carassius carassius]
MGFYTCVQKQLPESDGNNKTTLEKGGRNPPDVTLDDIAKDFLSFFNRFESLRKTTNNIEEKYDIKNDYGDYWSADDIKRAWGKTQRMDKKSDKRKHWAHVIILQMLKRLVYDGCKQNPAQEDHDDTTIETKQSCEKTPRMKENKDTIVNRCEQQKSIDNNEKLNFTDKPNQIKAETENGGGEDGLWSTIDVNQARGKAESMKRNSEDRSTQRSDELETVEAAGEDRKSSGANHKSTKSGFNQTIKSGASQGRSGAGLPAGRKATKNDPVAADDQSSTDDSESESEEAENHPEDESIYICIPVTEMFGSQHTPTEDDYVENDDSLYKLIDGLPSATDIRQRKSYTMSFSNKTNNAEWVYEILNRETLEDNCKKLKSFGNVYHKGHLAAAANHRWCRGANHDTNLFSNIIPQHKKLNQGMWKKLENHCRNIQRKRNCNVHVYTGPLYLRETNDKLSKMKRLGGKVIPTHLFKVIIVENEDGTVEEPECYVMPNEEPEKKNLDDYSGYTIEDIEKYSGLTFLKRPPNANMRDCIKTVTLRGEAGNGETYTVDITGSC